MLVLRLGAVFALACLNVAQSLNFTNTTTPSATPTTTLANSTTLLSSIASLNATTTLKGNDSASICNAKQISWSLASKKYSSDHPIVSTATNTRNYTSTIFSKNNWNCTRMCDTICYAGPTSLTLQTTAIYEEYPVTWTDGAPYPTPSPNCSIGFSDCLNLKTVFSSEWDSYWDLPAASRDLTTMPANPSCSACVSTGCTFAHAGMSLYFWPVTTSVSRDYCAFDPVGGPMTTGLLGNDTTYTPITTGPYAVVDGITMYQGNVYLSLLEPFVTDNCGHSLTRRSPGPNVLTIASDDLYSVRKYPHNVIPWSVNYDDFNEPTPWSAYVGGWYCANNRPICSVVFQHNYYPVMVMPPEIRNLDPNWASCAFDQYGIYDPPVALHSVGNIFTSATPTPTPNDPNPVITPPTSAKPGQSATDGDPVATPPPNSPSDPADPSDPPGNGNPQDPPGNNNPTPSSSPQDPNDPQDPPGNNNPSPSNRPQGPSDPQDPPSNNPGPAPGNPASNPNANPTSPANNPPSNPSPPVITVGPSVIPVDPTGGVIVNPGTTLTSGGPPVVISSTTFSIGDGGLTVVSPSTSTVVPVGSGPVTVPLGPGNAPITLDPAGSVVVGGTTLRPGDPAITVSGTTMSMGVSGIVIIGPGGTTSTIPIPSDPSTSQTITVGSSTFTVVNGDVVLAPGTTLHFGDPAVTVSGVTYSIGPSGLIVVSPQGTSTIPINMATQVVTIGGEVYTAYDGELVLGPGTTIGIGDPAVMIDGTTFTVGSGGITVLSGTGSGMGTTVPITGTETDGSPTATGAGVAHFTGEAGKKSTYKVVELVVIVGVVMML